MSILGDKMKSLIIIFLIFLILGLYFYTEPTKGLIRVTGKVTSKAIIRASNEIVTGISESVEAKTIKDRIINDTIKKGE